MSTEQNYVGKGTSASSTPKQAKKRRSYADQQQQLELLIAAFVSIPCTSISVVVHHHYNTYKTYNVTQQGTANIAISRKVDVSIKEGGLGYE